MTLSAIALRPATPLRLLLAGDALPDAASAAVSEALGAPAQPLAAQAAWPSLADGTPLPERFAAAYGLALLGAKGAGTQNFLRGALAPAIPAPVKRRGQLIAGGSLAVLILGSVLSLSATYWRLDAAISATQAKTAAIVEQAVPEAAPGLTLVQKLSVLRGRLAEQNESAKSRNMATGTVIEVLAAIHQGLGAGSRVQVRRIATDDRRVTIDAAADDYNTVEEVKRRLAGMPLFSDVEIKGAKNVPDKKQVEFQLDMRLAGQGESAS